jgi:hypothetical protein
MPPDSGRKVKKKEKSFSVQQSGIAKSGLQKKMAKKGKKKSKDELRNHPLGACRNSFLVFVGNSRFCSSLKTLEWS